MKMTPRTPRLALAMLRCVGGCAFAAPQLATASFGVSHDPNSSYLVRLFAARNLALAVGLLASDTSGRRLWWQMGVACDALDAGAGLLALRVGKPRSSAMVDLGASLVATGLGMAGLIAEGRAG
jgi:hypothetical protein